MDGYIVALSLLKVECELSVEKGGKCKNICAGIRERMDQVLIAIGSRIAYSS